MNGKVRNLESVLEEMHKAAENRREIERQHKEALVCPKVHGYLPISLMLKIV